MPTVGRVQDVTASEGTLRILVVEDECKMANLLQRALEEQRCAVHVAYDGHDGLRMAQEFSFDVITLDVMLPGMDGFQIACELRQMQIMSPILFLTARDSKVDVVRGLELGGDDYLTKPFSFIELLARIRALARRRRCPPENQLQVGDLVLDCLSQEVTRSGRRIELSRTEYVLLECLMRNTGRALSRHALFDAVWGPQRRVEDNTLDVFIRLLRKKVDHGHQVELIQTVRGFGYRMTRQ